MVGMSTFDETKHPRNSKTKRFVEKANSAPAVGLLTPETDATPAQQATERTRQAAVLAADAHILGRALRNSGAIDVDASGFADVYPDRVPLEVVAGYNTLAKEAIAGGYLPSHGLPLSEHEAKVLMRHPEAAPEMLDAIAASDDLPWRVATELSIHSKASPELLANLAEFDDTGVRHGVASHKNVSAETLATLATDPLRDIRATVALNPNTSGKTQRRLAADIDPQVQLALVRCDKLDPAAESLLNQSRFLVVREHLHKRAPAAA